MTGRILSSGRFAAGDATPGFNASGLPLVLTGVGHVTPALTLGDDVTRMTDRPDKFRYKVEVDGTGIEEYYEYDEKKSAAEVRADWYSDVKENWGADIADSFKGNITVIDLWRKTQADTTSEGQEETNKESQKDSKAPLGSEANPLVMPPPDKEDKEE